MRFVKFNYLDESAFCFCLDDLTTFESTKKNETLISLRNGRIETLPIDVNDFSIKVYSDEHGDNEYQLIEIDQLEPPSFPIQYSVV